ncbi:SusC/RagA family TonB-linked outer membrane protein [Dysgonomonas sp. 216]|uniref:SusC/RagA family TonB-linked outer membrane protein n=1 Tax=Dysgonomonas sp. 216 TaxID=2302934 RepID=UPI0013D259E3|nr:SusC/RagA family TonB-linked outer membrane protein [Dysgonomonas sp. 216]NDW18839.1 SusC/RagA family TonB-linked outer membrane protein [Dysgonomonas sp. 216]
MTTEDGTFSLKVPHLEVNLSVDAPGYMPQVVGARGRTQIEIRMLGIVGNSQSIYEGDVFSPEKSGVVTEFTPGITSLEEDLTSRLSGQIRGITHSGVQGGGAAFFARGLNSLNTSAQPLFIVDGVIWQMQDNLEESSIHSGFFNNPLSLLDPDNIEKVTVLKDGNSIYGSKGANGVVLIETKRSRNMATEITANISLGYRAPLKTTSVMNAEQYRLYASDILSGMFDNSSYIDRFKFLEDDETKSYYKANHNDTDWFDLINDGALIQKYGLSVRGGDETALYAFSLGYSTNDGNIDKTDYDRLNVRFNSDINLTDKLNLRFDIAFAQTQNSIFNDGIDELSSPFYMSLIKAPVYNPYQYELNGSLTTKLNDTDELGVGNPLALLQYGESISKRYRFNINALPSYAINENLKVGVLFGYSWDKLNENSFRPNFGIPEVSLTNDFGEIYAVSRNYVKDMMTRQTSVSLDANANWNIMKNSVHSANVLGGYRYYADTYESSYGEGHNTSSDNIKNLSNTDASLRYSTGLKDNWRSMAWYINADYAYKSRYLLNVNAAMDASSRFGKEADGALKLGGLSWGTFPSVSAGWLISSEEFMANVNFVNYLKLNVGYGLSGNDNILNYATRSYFTSVKFIGNAMGLILENIGNEKLKWETTGTARVGLDLSMFDNRWSVSADFYSAKTKDLLTRKKLSEIAGLRYFWSNDGELKNKGFEISTNVRIVNQKDVKLDFGAMIGHYKNEITALGNGSFTTDMYGGQILTAVGQPAGVFYGYKTKGVLTDSDAADRANLYVQSESGALTRFEAGDMYFVDAHEDNIIDEKDRQIIGDPNPDFYGNFNFNLTYKGFTLGALFSYSVGNDAYNALRANLEAGNDIYNQATSMQNRWVANGQQTSIPRATYGDPMGNSRFSDRWIEDASFLKFKSLSLSYKLPLNLTFLQEVSVWGSVNNLYTFTKYLGNDPEFSYGNSVLSQGVDAGLIPQTRSFNFGVKINL